MAGPETAAPANGAATAAPKIYGRGGAGNINSRPSAQLQTSDLATPTIKSATFTTGRGGSGNMAKAKEVEETRLRQDVDTPKAHGKEMEGTYHWGRGGQGNMTTVGRSEKEQAREKRASKSAADAERPRLGNGNENGRTGSFSAGIVNKGKELLGLKKEKNKEGTGSENESAIE